MSAFGFVCATRASLSTKVEKQKKNDYILRHKEICVYLRHTHIYMSITCLHTYICTYIWEWAKFCQCADLLQMTVSFFPITFVFFQGCPCALWGDLCKACVLRLNSPNTLLALGQSRSWRVSKQRAVTDDSLNKSVNMRWLICLAASSNAIHSTILFALLFPSFQPARLRASSIRGVRHSACQFCRRPHTSIWIYTLIAFIVVVWYCLAVTQYCQ